MFMPPVGSDMFIDDAVSAYDIATASNEQAEAKSMNRLMRHPPIRAMMMRLVLRDKMAANVDRRGTQRYQASWSR